MADTKSKNGLTPPYSSWKTFKNFLEELGEKGVPERIDRSVMKKKSGSVQSQLRTTMRFLNLIDDSKTVKGDRLESLVQAYQTDQWSEVLQDVLLDAYEPYIEDLPLETGTAKQLEEVFKEKSDVSGSSLVKAIRFFLNAMKETEVELSSHFAPPSSRRKRKSSKEKKKRKKSREEKPSKSRSEDEGTESGADEREEPMPPEPEGFRTLTLPIPGRSEEAQLVIPEDLAPAEWGLISTYVESYVKMNLGEE